MIKGGADDILSKVRTHYNDTSNHTVIHQDSAIDPQPELEDGQEVGRPLATVLVAKCMMPSRPK